MPIMHNRDGDDVIYRVTGPLDPTTATEYFNLNYHDYHAIGDAIGVIIDVSQMERITISGLQVAQSRMRGVIFDTPVAFVGRTDSLFMTFLRGLEPLSSRGKIRFGFFDSIEKAKRWIDAWYITHNMDRIELRGRITANPTPPPDSPDSANV